MTDAVFLMMCICLQLDLWYVILNGAVEISHPEGRVETLCMGNSFGISPSLNKQYMNGEVRTKGDDCQVKEAFTVCVFVNKRTMTACCFISSNKTHDP